MAYRNYATAVSHIVDTNGQGDFTTIASALTASSSGQTIFIRPGTYTENLTLKAGVNLTAFGADSSQNGTGKVIISGTCTLTTAGSVTISGIQLQTNSAALLAVTGSAASVVNLFDCYLNCTNNTGITFSTSSASGTINIRSCSGDLGTTGIALFSHSSAGNLNIYDSDFTNSGSSTTANTISAGSLTTSRIMINNPITSSSTGGVNMNWSGINCNAINTTALTANGSGGTCTYCSFSSGTASAVSIGASSYNLVFSLISSSNTNALTGAGTVNQYGNVFTGSSHQVNTTTTTGGTLNGLTQGTAPNGGFLGERITNNAANVSLTDSTTANITSISLTAGVWDVSGMGEFNSNGGALTGTQFIVGINTTSAVLPGTGGVNQGSLPTAPNAASDVNITICPQRYTFATTTIVYLVARGAYSVGTLQVTGVITATRVG
jgi:hypothetical protein